MPRPKQEKGIVMKLGLIGACVISIAALAACKSEDQRKQDYRAQRLTECKSAIAARGGAPGMNGDRFCTCLVDRVVGSRSTAELQKLDSNKAESDRVGTEAGVHCASEQLSGGAPPPPAAAAPAAPAEENAANEVDTE